MQEVVIVALIVAVGSGLAIGVQSTFTNWGGRLIGSIGTGLLVNVSGGTLAALILLLFSNRLTGLNAQTFRGAAPFVIAAGALGL